MLRHALWRMHPDSAWSASHLLVLLHSYTHSCTGPCSGNVRTPPPMDKAQGRRAGGRAAAPQLAHVVHVQRHEAGKQSSGYNHDHDFHEEGWATTTTSTQGSLSVRLHFSVSADRCAVLALRVFCNRRTRVQEVALQAVDPAASLCTSVLQRASPLMFSTMCHHLHLAERPSQFNSKMSYTPKDIYRAPDHAEPASQPVKRFCNIRSIILESMQAELCTGCTATVSHCI